MVDEDTGKLLRGISDRLTAIEAHDRELAKAWEANVNRFLAAFLSTITPTSIGGEITEKQRTEHPNGVDRVRLLYLRDGLARRLQMHAIRVIDPETGQSRPIREPPLDFHSLVWEKFNDQKWRKYASLSARDFRRRGDYWVCDLHALDPDRGTASIRIGEMRSHYSDAPQWLVEEVDRTRALHPSAKGQWCRYSWVSWDLRSNRQVVRY